MNILFVLSHIDKSLQWEWFAEEMKNRGINQTYVIVEDGILKSCCLHKELSKMGIKCHFLPHRSKLSHLINIVKTVSIIKFKQAANESPLFHLLCRKSLPPQCAPGNWLSRTSEAGKIPVHLVV